MNKTAIKNFAIWARNKLIADITYKAGLLGITENGNKSSLPQSTQTVQFFDIGTKEPSSITGIEIQQRKKLVEEIERKAKQSDYATAYKNVIEEVAYTWFNRLIAIRFMEVNDYLPTRIRVLSSESIGKAEPDLVTHALEANLDYSAYEKDRIIQLKHENMLDELFRMLFIKQCNALNANLPELFERTSDYTELLLNVSFTDKEGVVNHLVNDIYEDDFNVTKEGQVEIIGWLYQYYNTEPKQAVFDGLKKNVKITKEKIPAATQLFTPDWIVRYMVENSLGRLWLESHPNDALKANWNYYLDEAEQTPEVAEKLSIMRSQSPVKSPEDIRLIDPCMGSGHILVYAFDVLMQIYVSEGYNPRDAAKFILEKNIYGLDIDRRAYQLACFSLMMKARQYNRRILTEDVKPQVYHPAGFPDGEEYGSLVKVDKLEPMPELPKEQQMTLFDGNYDAKLNAWNFKRLLAQTYDVVVTNPPYMGYRNMGNKLAEVVSVRYPDSKSDLFSVFIEKCGELLKSTGYQAMITQHSWMFLSSYEKLRSKLIHRDIINMAHLGSRAFEEIGGEVVQTTAFVLAKRNVIGYEATYVRLVDYNSQDAKEASFLSGSDRYTAKKESYEKIPGCPVAYWISDSVLDVYDKGKTLGDIASPKTGMTTGDNERFLRLWFEVEINKTNFHACDATSAKSSDKKWFTYSKGGGFRRWYGYFEYLINWYNNGSEIKSNVKANGLKAASVRSESLYFKPLISWSAVSSAQFSCRYVDGGSLFDSGGSSVFVNKDAYYLLAVLNAKIGHFFLSINNATMNFQPGDVAAVPIVIDRSKTPQVETVAKNNVDLSRTDWDSFETSWDFKRHPLLCGERTVAAAYSKWEREAEERFQTLKANEEELNRIFIDIYGMQNELTPEVEDKDLTVRRADLGREIRSLISYAVGCMFGRYSLDVDGLAYAGGDWDAGKYRSFIPDKDNILPICDDEYFDDDIVGRFVAFVKIVFGANTLEENLRFITGALGGNGTPREVIRDYFMNEFYKDHCKIYQKRPIYWLFDSGKQNGFKALIYMHRYDENNIGNLRIDYLHRMQRIYENEIARMQDTIENSKDAREVTESTKRKEKLIKQLQETKEYDEKIAHLALARTSIDLDDGVKVNYEKIQTDRDGNKLEVLAKI
ncbi:MAG: BREX-1 system adenine-specific DNA-methyltransferase PglX [Desulfitobacterium hafniense]|nr:BREX-1 system adenine-specific DNA-methyltransferase PglX [Desulfitobacterium hafniense]